jgi:indolepyruvate ferredoxin oxidoreductase, beta subunit
MTTPIKIAILAMGGEGGGVLADWIVDLGEQHGFIAQTTSVAGVAQRTGATIYYLELFPRAAAEAAGAEPVLALMPTPGDVDVLLASELMEAGRAVQRGLVTSDRTTLIASTHRVYSIHEKSAMGDGTVNSQDLLNACQAAAKNWIAFDMAALVEQHGSVISAVLFGALCASNALPFSRDQFEATISRGKVGVAGSLKAFAAGLAAGVAMAQQPVTEPQVSIRPPFNTQHKQPAIAALLQRLATKFGDAERTLMLEGVRRLIDYQDVAYAELFLTRMDAVARHQQPQLTAEVGRHLALWMSYEDTVRVADLKTRASRFARVQKEVKATEAQVLAINEYMHPRLQEICETLPAGLGRWLEKSSAPRKLVEPFTKKGRVVRTSSLRGYLMLYGVAALRPWRRGSLRFQHENAAIETWLARVHQAAVTNAPLALELAHCQRLVKGYSDTLERGKRNFDTVMAAAARIDSSRAASLVKRLRDAALADEHGHELRQVLAAEGLAV